MALIVYLSCALTGAGRNYYEACSFYEQLRDRITKCCRVKLRFILPHLIDPSTGLAIPDGEANYQAAAIDSEDVFHMDMELIESSDVILAWLDQPSHGAGAEVAIAAMLGKPIVAVVRPPLSKFLDGLLDTFKAVKLIESEYTAVWQIAATFERINHDLSGM